VAEWKEVKTKKRGSVLVVPSFERDILEGRIKPKLAGQLFFTLDTGRFYVYTREEAQRVQRRRWFTRALHRARTLAPLRRSGW